MQKEYSWLLQEKYQGIETPEYKKDIKRLEKGEPLDYVIGFTTFLGCNIDLSKKPLIPRTETEYWMEKAIDEIKTRIPFDSAQGNTFIPIKVLDMFAGSGCIGISIMRHIENVDMIFVDKEKKCIDQIKINAKVNGIDKKRYTVIQSDIFKKVTGKFDYIFANPPYIPTTQKSKLAVSVLDYEPKTALFGGADGLFYINTFLQQAKDYLTEDGKIYMEFDVTQKKQIDVLLKKYGYSRWEFYKDQYKRWRWVVVGG